MSHLKDFLDRQRSLLNEFEEWAKLNGIEDYRVWYNFEHFKYERGWATPPDQIKPKD